jgi:L-threonylcarbamoyladenylate synthase
VLRQLGRKIPLVVDGGQAQVGIESTVLDLSVTPPSLLRPGMVHEQSLLAITGELAQGDASRPTVLKSPGLLRKHYAPRARLAIWCWRTDQELAALTDDSGTHKSKIHVISHSHVPSGQGFGRVAVIPHDAEAFGRAIYAELHQCDDAGADLIVVEALPETEEWRAIADRLNRAATKA